MKTGMMSQRRYNSPNQLSMTILLGFFVQKTLAFPYMVKEPNQSNKCVTAEFPLGSRLNIDYEILDFEGRSGDYFISFTPVLKDGDDDFARPQSVTRQQIDTPTGQIKYNKHMDKRHHEHDVKVCVEVKGGEKRPQALLSPVFFSLKFVEVFDDTFKREFPGMNFPGGFMTKPKPNGTGIGQDQNLAKEHMSYLEKSIFNMIRETDLLIGSADVSKDEDAEFSKKSMDMYSAAKWWPIMHLLVLFVTGYTQANHIVSFFKSRHII